MQELPQDQLAELYQSFPKQFKSVILGTVSAQGEPQASYAPCVVDEERNIYIFVSGLSAHTQNLTATGRASALFIQDEAQTPQMFARKRLSYSCEATLLERQSDRWQTIAEQFESRFGNIIEVMKGLADFRIFQLSPQSGRFVVGFGAAYDIDPNDLSQLIHKGKP
ncbi:pyridoxamine 5'-phosphate oxidase family protein [Leptolyngbya sp. BC1307]|uniref:HugZ family pyridoxamine 5'-phosphate oxidase n=1 Tax=Leptolyngbya sp. BC1307 TaxID=2029589 RepID=UPI000EFB8FBB|nr:pyridoxamine 5'-phosphate oxidase family protein [Leptolyngbya sp. BC1307]